MWLTAAVVVGAGLRLSFPGRIAVEHFDEGVYASNFWFGGYPYPAQHLYAPPLLPAMIEWSMIIASLCGFTPTGFVPMIPCLIAGIATIPSIWWVGRRWFGPSAGLVSAWLVATSDFHACYSRAALTDVPVCLFVLWSVYFVWQALVKAAPSCAPFGERGKVKSLSVGPVPWREILLAGGFAGLAWWTKYNGWLPLAIGLAGGAFWQLLTPRCDRQIWRTGIIWILVAATAGFVWSPVLWSLQKQSGYAAVAANHRQYVVGLKGWRDSALKQLEHVGMYENGIGMFTEAAVWMARNNAHRNGYQDRNFSEIIGALASIGQQAVSAGFDFRLLSAFAMEVGNLFNRCAVFMHPLTLLIASAVALRLKLRFDSPAPPRIAACLLAVWLAGMTIATPFYYPYPRLVLPWLFAIWLGVGLAVQFWRNRNRPDLASSAGQAPAHWSPHRIEWVIVVWVVVNCLMRSVQGTSHALSDRSHLADVAQRFSKTINEELSRRGPSRDAIVLVWGEPAMVFGLNANGQKNVSPVQNLDALGQHSPLPTFAVFGEQSRSSPQFVATNRMLSLRKLCQTLQAGASHLVELDSQKTEDFYGHIPKGLPDVEPKVWLYGEKK